MIPGRAVILLSTYNGTGFLPDQLASYRAQSHPDWSLLWRDDGSSDGSSALVAAFGQETGRATRLDEPAGNIGISASYFALLRAALPRLGPDDAIAFSDQDDVWLPDKLARGMAALESVPAERHALYCAQQTFVDTALKPLGHPPPPPAPPGFPAALAKNVVTGCATLLNRAAAALVVTAPAPPGVLHDWWCYIRVAAAGGALIFDPEPAVLYRQHAANVIGAAGAWRSPVRGPGKFMSDMRAQVAALQSAPEHLTEAARRDLDVIAAGLAGGTPARLRALRLLGLRRAERVRTLALRLAFLIG
jgi:glycosyltransferase involved in cell wall biosynthesis